MSDNKPILIAIQTMLMQMPEVQHSRAHYMSEKDADAKKTAITNIENAIQLKLETLVKETDYNQSVQQISVYALPNEDDGDWFDIDVALMVNDVWESVIIGLNHDNQLVPDEDIHQGN